MQSHDDREVRALIVRGGHYQQTFGYQLKSGVAGRITVGPMEPVIAFLIIVAGSVIFSCSYILE